MSRRGVVQFQRRALPGNFSIERVFQAVRLRLPPSLQVTVATNLFESRGVLPRLADALRARWLAGEVNHVLGDVHYLMWFLPRRGSILTVHDCVSLERLSGLPRTLLWLLWYRLPLARAEQVTAVSEYTRQALEQWLPGLRDDVQVIPPPLSPELTRVPLPARGARLRLLQVGTAPNKNLPRVIQACRGLPVTLEIIGRLEPEARQLLEAVGVPYEAAYGLDAAQLRDAYARCDAVIFASTYEGFGLPIIEAQAVGRPVITSRLCSMPEAAGGAALLVDPFDPSDIRRAILRLLDDPAHAAELVRLGHLNAARYAPERIAELYAALYRRAGSVAALAPGASHQLGPSLEAERE